MRFLTLLFVIGAILGCKTTKSTMSDENTVTDLPASVPGIPIISWEQQKQNLGKVKLGESRELIYEFTNSGTADLLIEIVTSCRCTSLEWPRQPIPPGESAKILVTYDSTGQKLGTLTKTIDVIGNMDPIVAEAFFDVTVVG